MRSLCPIVYRVMPLVSSCIPAVVIQLAKMIHIYAKKHNFLTFWKILQDYSQPDRIYAT